MSRLSNLLNETLEIIQMMGLDIQNIDWVGSEDYGYITFEQFSELAEKTNYDDGYGSQVIARDLLIVFKDGSYMQRDEYDGAESWGYKTPPKKPENKITIKTLGDDSYMWDTLRDMNEKDSNEDTEE